jgi:hypothetical protein
MRTWTSFGIGVNLTDEGTYAISLYLLDWDSTARVERIDVLDVMTGALLDRRTVSIFNGGIFSTWNITGHVTLAVTRLSGSNSVASGIFFNLKSTAEQILRLAAQVSRLLGPRSAYRPV